VSPVKIIIIAVLLYLGYRLLVGDWNKKKDHGADKSALDGQDEGPVADVLIEDPICHKLVPKQQAIRLKSNHNNEILYFCSEECCNLFVRQEGENE